MKWLGGLGTLDIATEYQPHEFRFEIKWVKKKNEAQMNTDKQDRKQVVSISVWLSVFICG